MRPSAEHEAQRVRCARIERPGVGGAGQRRRTIQPRGDLRARGAAVEALERRPRDRPRAPAARSPRRCTRVRPGCGDELQGVTEIGHACRRARRSGRAPRAPRRRRRSIHGRSSLHGRRGGALGGARGQHDLDAGVGVDVDAHAPRARGAADGVGDLAQTGGVVAGRFGLAVDCEGCGGWVWRWLPLAKSELAGEAKVMT